MTLHLDLKKGHAVFLRLFALALACTALLFGAAYAAEVAAAPKKPFFTDANHNGVRDDVDDFVMESYYPTKPEQDAALQWSRAVDAAVAVDRSDKEKMKAVSLRSALALKCIQSRFNGRENSKKAARVVGEIQFQTLKTRPRFKQYWAFLRSSNRVTPTLSKGNPCERRP